MPMRIILHTGGAAGALVLFLAGLLAAGCGMIADKDRIVIARAGGENITRGDLFRIIREMDDRERPNIRNKGDLLRVLNAHLDEQIKLPLGRELDASLAPEERERYLALAREQVFRENEEMNYRAVYAMEPPADGQPTPAMQAYNISVLGLRNMKDLIDDQVDTLFEKLMAELALMRLAEQALEAGELDLDRDDLIIEYELRREEFRQYEWIKFDAIRFPNSREGAVAAAQLREQAAMGGTFDAVLERVAGEMPDRVMLSQEIEHNTDDAKFADFWRDVAGAKPGSVLGPVFLPEHQGIAVHGDQMVSKTVPSAFLTVKVLDHRPAETLTLDQVLARPDTLRSLAMPVAQAVMMEKLREQRGVEIYEDRLPDIGALGS
jgi:hypothetical protein